MIESRKRRWLLGGFGIVAIVGIAAFWIGAINRALSPAEVAPKDIDVNWKAVDGQKLAQLKLTYTRGSQAADAEVYCGVPQYVTGYLNRDGRSFALNACFEVGDPATPLGRVLIGKADLPRCPAASSGVDQLRVTGQAAGYPVQVTVKADRRCGALWKLFDPLLTPDTGGDIPGLDGTPTSEFSG